MNTRNRTLRGPDYTSLAAFRYELRSFLNFSEEAARKAGFEPQQHQALLAMKALDLEAIAKATERKSLVTICYVQIQQWIFESLP